MMDVIFGKIRPKELFSCGNGIIIHSAIERWFDSGVFAIVPDLPERPTVDMIRKSEISNYESLTPHSLDFMMVSLPRVVKLGRI